MREPRAHRHRATSRSSTTISQPARPPRTHSSSTTYPKERHAPLDTRVRDPLLHPGPGGSGPTPPIRIELGPRTHRQVAPASSGPTCQKYRHVIGAGQAWMGTCTNPPHRPIFSKRVVRLPLPFRSAKKPRGSVPAELSRGRRKRRAKASLVSVAPAPQPLRRKEGREQRAMERAVPVRKPHTSTADLLTWSAAGPDAAAGASPAASSRPSLKVRSRLPRAASQSINPVCCMCARRG